MYKTGVKDSNIGCFKKYISHILRGDSADQKEQFSLQNAWSQVKQLLAGGRCPFPLKNTLLLNGKAGLARNTKTNIQNIVFYSLWCMALRHRG